MSQKIKPRLGNRRTESVDPPTTSHGVELADEILDEIDAVLEETVTQRAYIQKGGQ